ncbi:hypothetical protein GCM10007301_10310 [Azorhizobium oxalatiphilum]|uniref:Uncharacterized protein n=1 Tax=Azorhizobium oxalatiphilum TaxID=980631 RepID=A0A917F6L2_9HYPH|nr:hypothetical protein [Azorhizobium oxalatiphilum]GGF52749.1 hypothetical protein GCM10007301_10310 [Azorhizobium oxalatiphilum]
MIEQIMFFALGALSATLIALLVLPAVWHRAVRLTTRRVEAAVPVSIFEVQADKDQQRAAFALSQRRLELQLDQTRETIVAHAATIEQLRLKAFDLDKRLTAKTAEHDALTLAHTALTSAHETLTARFADTSMLLEQATTTLANTRAALATTSTALAEATSRVEELQVTLAERETTLLLRDGRIMELSRQLDKEQEAHAATGATLKTTEADLARARAELTSLGERAGQTETRLSGELSAAQQALIAAAEVSEARGTALADRTTQAQELDTALTLARGDLDSTQSALQVLEHKRMEETAAAEAELRRQSDELNMLRADHAMMSSALERARAARDAVLAETASLGDGTPVEGGSEVPAPEAAVAPPPALLPADLAAALAASGDDANRLLKQTILDLAARVAARAEGGRSATISSLIAQDEPAGTGITLAARIRAARAEDARTEGAAENAPSAAVYPLARQAAGE